MGYLEKKLKVFFGLYKKEQFEQKMKTLNTKKYIQL